MFNFGLNDYQAIHPKIGAYKRGHRYVVEFVDGTLGTVRQDGCFSQKDSTFSNPPRAWPIVDMDCAIC